MMNRNRKINSVAKKECKSELLDRQNNGISIELEPRASQENMDYTQTDMYKQLRPLLVCMRIFGLYFRRNVNSNGNVKTEPVILWCYFVTFLLLMNVFRSFTVYRTADNFDDIMVQRLLFTIWSAECALKAILLLVFCYKQNGLRKFFREWKTTCSNQKLDRFSKVIMVKYMILAFLFILVNSVVFNLILVYVPVLRRIYLEVIWRDADLFENLLPFKIVLAVLAILNSSSSMFPVSLFVVLSCAVGKQLKKLSDELENAMSDEDFYTRLEYFRLRHQHLCALIDILDTVFAPMIAGVYSANIPMFCLVLYTMVTSIDIHVSIVLLNLFWLSFILLQMTIVSVTAAWVNVKVSI